MDFQKAGILLDKIHALFKNMSADSDSVSEIEKDLMRAYLRQFYELFLPHGQSPAETPLPVELPPLVAARKPAKKTEILLEEEPGEDDDEPMYTPPPPPKKKEKDPEPPAPKPTPRAAPSQESAEVKVEIKKHPRKPGPEEEEEIETLFEHHQARELSEKLSELPIQDLGKAMGLNEKVFTINELFDGNQDAFKQTIQALNSMTSFEEAKNYLVREIAVRYDWAHQERKNKAKNFIKLVRRRFI